MLLVATYITDGMQGYGGCTPVKNFVDLTMMQGGEFQVGMLSYSI